MLSRSSFVLLAAAVAAGVAVIIVASSPQVRAGPPPPVTVLDAASVRAAGRTISLPVRVIVGSRLLEPAGLAGGPPPRPLAAAPDGRTLAVSIVGRGQAGPLTIVRPDGSQLDVALPGVRGAAFDSSGAWLVAVDLSGVLWWVDAAEGFARTVADGPFGSAPTVLPDGRILALRISSLDAPTWSAAVTVETTRGAETPVAATPNPKDQLVYDATFLADGSVALVRHRIGGGITVVKVGSDGSELALMEVDAAPVAVSADAQWVAWAAVGRVMLGRMGAEPRAARDLGPGTGARFSPDGSLILISDGDGGLVVDLEGTRVTTTSAAACWLGDGRGCLP